MLRSIICGGETNHFSPEGKSVQEDKIFLFLPSTSEPIGSVHTDEHMASLTWRSFVRMHPESASVGGKINHGNNSLWTLSFCISAPTSMHNRPSKMGDALKHLCTGAWGAHTLHSPPPTHKTTENKLQWQIWTVCSQHNTPEASLHFWLGEHHPGTNVHEQKPPSQEGLHFSSSCCLGAKLFML